MERPDWIDSELFPFDDRWAEVERRLAAEENVDRPHEALGLGPALAERPDIADRFDARWKAVVNPEVVSQTLGKS